MIKTQDRTTKLILQTSLLLTAVQLLVWVLFAKKLPPQLPLFYSLPWGEKQLAASTQLLFLPMISIAVIVGNFILASFMTAKEKLAGQLLVVGGGIFSFLCLFTLVKIINLII